MSLIFISGISGAGKSTVCKALVKRGYEAYDTDEDGFSNWYNNQTWEIVKKPDENNRTADWYDKHDYNLSSERVAEISDKAKARTIFLCGIPANDTEFFNFFDKIFFLRIDKNTMNNRLKSREANTFGSSNDEIALLNKWFDTINKRYVNAGAVMIDSAQPLETVVQKIITQIDN